MIRNEYNRLKKVALHKPTPEEIICMSPEKAMYATVRPPDYWKVTQEFNEYVLLLESLDIDVIVDNYTQEHICPNSIFMRDIAGIIDRTIIIGRPKYDIRKNEIVNFKNFLAKSRLQSQFDIIELPSTCTFEGADLFVISQKEAIISVGNRTNIEAYDTIKRTLSRQGWNIRLVVAIPEGIPQHILGGKHIVDKDTIISRTKIMSHSVHPSFKNVIHLPEDSETINGYACNVVTVGPKEIIMPAGNPFTKRIYETNGITVHETPTQEISMMAGSLACMTLPLKRSN